MISVNLPDGSVAKFPDDTPPDAMKAAIQKKFPPKKTAQAAQPSTPQPTGYDAGLPAQGMSGLYEGAADVVGAPADLVNLGLRAGAAGLHAMGGPDVQFPVEPFGGSQSIAHAMGGLIKPETDDPMNQFVRSGARNVVATMAPVAGELAASARPARAAANLAATALGGTATGAAANYLADKAGVTDPNTKAAINALGTMGGNVATLGALKGVQKFITPFEIPPERAAMNQTMADEGVQLTAGQQTGNKPLQYVESELGGGPANQQAEQFTQAALSRAGINASRATPEVMDQAFKDIGQRFDDLSGHNVLVPDRALYSDLGQTWNQYSSLVNPNARAPIIENTIRDLVGMTQSGNSPLSGSQYQALRSRLETAARGTTDPQLASALRGVRSALDDTMERSIAQNNPQDLGAFREARQQYKNLIVLQQASAGAGENAAMGIISPAKLRQATAAQSERNYVRGIGDFPELARAGVATMTPLPNSGTSPRAMVHAIPSVIGGGIGAALGAHTAGAEGAGIGSALGAAAPYALAPAMFSGPAQRYLTNQVYTGALIGPRALVGPAVGSLSDLTSQQSTAPAQITVHGASPTP